MASTPIVSLLAFVRPSGRDDSDDRFPFPVAVAHNEDPELKTHPQEDEAVFVLRMVGIEIDLRVLIEKSSLRLLEGDPMLPLIGQILALVPDESQAIHAYIVCTVGWLVKS
jgi:hypothetical protein